MAVNGTATGTHDDTFQRSGTHGGVKALAALNCCDGGTVAQVAGNDVQLLRLLAQKLCSAQRNVAVGGAVEAVAADLILFVVLVGQSIHISILGHGLVETGVKYGYLRNAGHNFLASADTGQVVGVVERAKLAALFNCLDYLFVDDNGAGELFTAVENSVSYRTDLGKLGDHTVLGVGQSLNYDRNRLAVVLHIHVDLISVLSGNLMLKSAAGDTDTLAKTLCKKGVVGHINELIFYGRGACVDNENFHLFISFQSFLIRGDFTTFLFSLQEIFTFSFHIQRKIIKRLPYPAAARRGRATCIHPAPSL